MMSSRLLRIFKGDISRILQLRERLFLGVTASYSSALYSNLVANMSIYVAPLNDPTWGDTVFPLTSSNGDVALWYNGFHNMQATV